MRDLQGASPYGVIRSIEDMKIIMGVHLGLNHRWVVVLHPAEQEARGVVLSAFLSRRRFELD